MADLRGRNFATVVYPDSAPENWIDILSDFHIPAFISPLHDQDVNVTGEAKKPHWHVMVMYEGKKSIQQVGEVFAAIGGVGCEQISTIRGYARYLCHLDNPEKVQYNPDEVKQLAGADYNNIIGLPTDKYKCLREMQEFINSQDVEYYSDLADYALEYRQDWYRILCDSGTYFIREYIKSRSHKKKKEQIRECLERAENLGEEKRQDNINKSIDRFIEQKDSEEYL